MNAQRMRSGGLLVTVAALLALIAPAAAGANAVTDWNLNASNAIVVTAGQPPHAAALSFAMVQGAVYDAVNSIDGGHQPYLDVPAADPAASKDAAAATAAFRVLVGLFPTQLGALQTLYDLYMANIPAAGKAEGTAAGEAAAAAMLLARQNDGRGGPFTIVPGSLPGEWRPAPPTFALDPTPWVGNVRPFLVPDVEMLRTDPPNELKTGAYAKDYNEVKEVGALHSTTRTTDQTDAAIWWQDHGFALWNRIQRSLVTSQGLDIVDSARMFAMTNLAAADAAIGCWNNKYYWNFWRPVTAIRMGNADGNSQTEGDPTWLPLFDPSTPAAGAPLITPGFPDHPSGHTCGSSSIVHTLQDFFGTDKVPFSAFSNKSLTTRSFDRLSEALQEVINARVWAGIHFRTADTEGAQLGKKVAHWERQNYFKPVR